MSVRNLEHLFKPRSIALIGASDRPGSVGAFVGRNLLQGGFSGPIAFVNRRAQVVEGVPVQADVNALPFVPDLGVVCIPPAGVAETVAALGARGAKAAVVITAGLGDTARQAMLEAARPHLLRVLGPNCLGVMAPRAGVNASFAHIAPKPGGIAFVTQSGGMATSVLDWASARGIGFSHFVSTGDMADVDFGDMLDYLAADPATTSVLLYIEAVTHARKFMSAARACARLKPVVVIKAGRHIEGAKAAASHTGALAGSDAVYDAAFRRAGLLRVGTMEELFQAVETLALAAPVHGGRLAILTNGGGPGVLATDALIEAGGKLATLSLKTIQALDACLPATWSHANPVDIIGDAHGDRYAAALGPLLRDPAVDATLVLNCPTALAPALDAAKAVITARAAHPCAPILTCWLGEETARSARALFSANGLPTYDTPEGAVQGFMHLVRYRASQKMLLEAPPSLPETFMPDVDGARAVLRQALADARSWLPPPSVSRLFLAYGIPMVGRRAASTPKEAGRAALEIGWPVALKIVSRDITHKSDVGGVALELASVEAVEQAAEQMLRRIPEAYPNARLDGFTVEPMLRRKGAHELIVGMTEDLHFGPVILFGHGGTGVEVIADKALALPPLNLMLAREMIERTRVAKLLHGYRDRPPAALDAVALTLVKVAQMAADLPEIADLEINPLLADKTGVIALDARVKIRPAVEPGASRLAIRPYPAELEQQLTLRDGTSALVRPVRPDDASAVARLFARMAPEDIRLRFFTAMQTVPPAVAARLTQIDYDREMALVAVASDGELLAIVHLICEPNGERGEFTAMVRSDFKGHGIGYGLMSRLIAYARCRNLQTMAGDVLAEDYAMLTLCKELGFELKRHPEESVLIRAVLDFSAAPAGAIVRSAGEDQAAATLP